MLQKVKELRQEKDLDIVNLLLQKNWLLIEITTKNNLTTFLLGRIG